MYVHIVYFHHPKKRAFFIKKATNSLRGAKHYFYYVALFTIYLCRKLCQKLRFINYFLINHYLIDRNLI